MLTTLQAGRGIAALSVVMFHLSIAMGDPRYGGVPMLREITWRGDLGVDFFFVLSGFIMMYIHEGDIGRAERWKKFAVARFTRLFPVYWLYTAVLCVLLAAGFGTVVQLPDTIADWLSVVFLVRLSDVQAPLGVAWTLFHEIAFYALFSILIINRTVGAVLLGLWMIGTALAFGYPPADHPTPLQTYFAAFNIDFLIGMGACGLMRHASLRTCGIAFALGLALLVVVLSFEYGVREFWYSGLVYGIAFGGIIAGATAWEQRRGPMTIPLLTQLGNASYTIYLIHVPIIGVILKVVVKLGVAKLLPGPMIYFATLAGVLAATYVAHVCAEIPIQRWMKALTKRGSRPMAATA